MESPLATKAVVEEKKDALEERGPKVVADEVESKEEDSEEGDKSIPCVASKGTLLKAKAKKGKRARIWQKRSLKCLQMTWLSMGPLFK